MKRNLLLVFVLIFCSGAMMSQITINSTNIVDVNDVVINAHDSTPDLSIVPGTAGASQTWDFSALNTHFYDSMAFMLPALTPYDTSFTGDNMAAYMDDFSGYGYFFKSSSEMQTIGIVGDVMGTGSPMEIHINPSETIMYFPFDYLDSFIDTSGMEMIMDTVKMEQITYKTVTADAWGTMTTPTGTYDVLRLYTEKIEIQEIFMWVVAVWVPVYNTSDTTYSYEWWTDDVNARFPVCSFDWNPDSMAVDGEVEFLYLNYLYTKQSEMLNNVNVYPNPSTGMINFTGENISTVEIVDLSGVEVYAKSFAIPVDYSSIDLSFLDRGIYIARINSNNNLNISKIVIE
jgi:hypothetical protein